MTWYQDGAVNVTTNSATVTGVGTAFIANVRPGQAFRVVDGSMLYDIVAVVSDTQMTIDPPWQGGNQTGADYRIVPVAGFFDRAYDALATAIAQWDAFRDGPLSGLFDDGAAGDSAMGFAAAPGTGWYRDASGNMVGQRAGATKLRLLSAGAEITGLLTGTAVQSNWIDTTAGRLLKPGAFGWGFDAANGSAPEAPGTLLADLTVSGLYRFSSTHTDAPSNAGVVLHFNRVPSSASGGMMQLAISNTGDMWVRVQDGASPTTFGAWSRIYNATNILGTVAQSGGVPTGKLFEKASNANGYYVRLADGTQMCWHRFTTSGTGVDLWTFPAAFLDINYGLLVTGDSSTGGTSNTVIKGNNNSTTQGGVHSLLSDGTTYAASDVSCFAVGRWF